MWSEERAGEGGEGARMSERYASLMETGFTRGTTDHFSTVGLAEPAPPSLQQVRRPGVAHSNCCLKGTAEAGWGGGGGVCM